MENNVEKRLDKRMIIFIIIIGIIIVLFLLNINKENKYKNNDELIKFQDRYLKGTFYYDKDLETDGVVYEGLSTKAGKISFQNDEPLTIISYNVSPIEGTKQSMISEYIESSEDNNIKHTNTASVKISKIQPIEATKIEFSSTNIANILVTYMVFDDENVYWFNYISEETKEIDEFKTMLYSFVIE